MNSLKYITFFTTILLCTNCLSQREKIDSLKKILPALKDSVRADCLNTISEAYTQEPSNGYDIWYLTNVHPDSAILFARKALEAAGKVNYIKGKAKASYNLGRIGLAKGIDFRATENYFREALQYSLQTRDDNFSGRVYASLGASQWYQSKFSEATKSLEKAELLFQKTADKNRLAVTYYLMSATEWQSGYYEKSLQHSVKGSEVVNRESFFNLWHLYKALGDYDAALNLLNKPLKDSNNSIWIGEIFVSLKQYDSAKYYYGVFERYVNSEHEIQCGKLLSRFGELYLLKNKHDSALVYLTKALNWHRKINDGNEIMWALLRLARTYNGQKNYDKARETATQLLNMAKETGARQYLPEAHFLLYNIFESLNNRDNALLHLRQFTNTKDVMDKDLSAHKLAFYKIKFEREQAQSRIDLLNKEKEVQQAKLQKESIVKNIFIAGSIVLLLLGFIIFRNIILKRKNEKQRLEYKLELQQSESEKTKAELQQQATQLEMQALRAQMNPHFIFNSLNSINRFILQNNKQQASEYLTKFSKLVRMILQNSQASLISLETELEALELYLDLEALRFEHHFEYKINVEKDLDIDVLKVPPLIIQPFVENAVWHGLMHKEEKGHLDIEVKQEENYLFFKVMDDGIGRKQAAELASKSATRHKSMGLKITADRIAMLHKLNGNESPVTTNDLINADGSAAGTEVIIKIPNLYD